MTAFLQRLLAQNGDAGLPDAVQPRPRARFEGSDGATLMAETVEQAVPEMVNRPQLRAVGSSPLPAEAPHQRDLDAVEQAHGQGIETISEEPRAQAQTHIIATTSPSVLPSPIEQSTHSESADFTTRTEGDPVTIQVTRVERIVPEVALLQPETPFHEKAENPLAAILPVPEPEHPHQIPEQSPVVRVSIGRVEVHSAAPPSAPVRPASPRRVTTSPKAVRSLDDYLRGRNEGRR